MNKLDISNINSNKIAIIHYLPIENYPPVINNLEIFGDYKIDYFLLTTYFNDSKYIKYLSRNIFRFNFKSSKFYFIYASYIIFNIFGFIILSIKRPNIILYYDTLSVFPALLYKKLKPRTKVYSHQHEYVSAEEIKKSKVYYKFLNWFERKNIHLIDLISHTNQDRIREYLKDNSNYSISKVFEWPNYPPKSWIMNRKMKNFQSLSFIYVGSLSVDNSYLSDFLDWFVIHENLNIDFFSQNATENTIKKILDTKNCSLKGTIEYSSLKDTLPKYDVGLVLYKPHIPNVKFCISNKVFEYLVCGLDVWCPKDIVTTYEWAKKNNYIDETCILPDFMFCIKNEKVKCDHYSAQEVFPYKLFLKY